MKKLDNISKKEIFSVPDDYFDKLPTRIQSRIAESKQTVYGFRFVTALKFALPVILLMIVSIIIFKPFQTTVPNAETLLASIDTEDLITYLDESDLSSDDVLETVKFERDDLNDVEEAVYQLNIDNELYEDFINEND